MQLSSSFKTYLSFIIIAVLIVSNVLVYTYENALVNRQKEENKRLSTQMNDARFDAKKNEIDRMAADKGRDWFKLKSKALRSSVIDLAKITNRLDNMIVEDDDANRKLILWLRTHIAFDLNKDLLDEAGKQFYEWDQYIKQRNDRYLIAQKEMNDTVSMVDELLTALEKIEIKVNATSTDETSVQ